MKNKFTRSVSLIALVAIACTKSAYAPDYSGNIIANSRNEALNLLPEESRLRYDAWKAGMVKGCSVTSIFDGNMEDRFVDLKMFFARTGNSLFLKPTGTSLPKDKDGNPIDWEDPEFAIFGEPTIPQIKSGTTKILATTKNSRNAMVNVATHIENGRCDVFVGGFKVDSIAVAHSIPTLAHSSQAKRERVAKKQTINKSEVTSRRGLLKFADGFVTGPGYSSLSVHPFFMNDPDTGPVINPEQDAVDFLEREFPSLERSSVYQHFPLSNMSTSSATVEFVGRTNEIPFGFHNQFFYGYERRLRDLRDSKTHALTTLWKFRPALVKIADPENTGSFIGNEDVDKYDWVFEVTSSVVGSIDEGGTAELKKFALKVPAESTRETAAVCFAKRSFAARTLADTANDGQQISVQWWDIANPCLALSKNIMKEILESTNLRTTLPGPDSDASNELTAIEEFRTILRMAKLTKNFNYNSWDYQFRELVKTFMDGDPEKDLGDLDPNNNVPVIAKTKQNYLDVKDAVTGGSNESAEFKQGLNQYMELAFQATFQTFDLRQLDILANIRKSAPKARGLLAESYRTYIQELSVNLMEAPKEGEKNQQWENFKNRVAKMEAISELPEGIEGKVEEADQLARKMGLDGWTQGHTRNFFRQSAGDITINQVIGWIANLSALENFLKSENARLAGQNPSKEYWQQDFKFRFMGQNWNALTLRYLERFSSVADFIPECATERDIVSKLWCSNGSNISNSTNGVLFPESRDRLWELSNELGRVLPRLGRGEDVAARTARQFFTPIFQNCKAETFRFKVKNLMSFLVRYAKNPPGEKAQPDFESRLGQAFSACN